MKASDANLKRVERCNARRVRHETKSKLGYLVLGNSTVDAVEQVLILILNCLSSNVTLGGSSREIATLNNDDIFCRGDAFVNVAARVEQFCSLDDLLLELLGVQGALFRGLDEQGRRRPAVSNDDALKNELTASGAEVILD